MIEDALPGRELEEILYLSRDTFRHWAFEGLLHPIKHMWQGKPENLYLVAEIRSALIGKGDFKRVALLDARGEKPVESAVEVASGPTSAAMARPPAAAPIRPTSANLATTPDPAIAAGQAKPVITTPAPAMLAMPPAAFPARRMTEAEKAWEQTSGCLMWGAASLPWLIGICGLIWLLRLLVVK